MSIYERMARALFAQYNKTAVRTMVGEFDHLLDSDRADEVRCLNWTGWRTYVEFCRKHGVFVGGSSDFLGECTES